MARLLCDLGLMSLVCDDLASLILDGKSAVSQLRASLSLRAARVPSDLMSRISSVCDGVCQSLSDFLKMPRECFDEALSCMGGDRADLLWWLRAMDEGHGEGFPAMLGQEVDPLVKDECARLTSALQPSFDALALGRGQFRESTRLSLALCASAVVESGSEGEGAADPDCLHEAARAATCWMSTERLRRRLRLSRDALPVYAASLVLAASWCRRAGLGQDLMLFVQKRQMRHFDPSPSEAGPLF